MIKQTKKKGIWVYFNVLHVYFSAPSVSSWMHTVHYSLAKITMKMRFNVSGYCISQWIWWLNSYIVLFWMMYVLEWNLLRRKWQGLQRLVAIAGGFLVMMGIILLGIAALSFSGYLNIGVLLENKHLLTFALVMVVVGLLDTFSAIIIGRWWD